MALRRINVDLPEETYLELKKIVPHGLLNRALASVIVTHMDDIRGIMEKLEEAIGDETA